MGTLVKRELSSLVLWPATYLIAAAYIIISGIQFIDLVSANNSADLESYYANTINTLIVLCPIFGARSLAEERASGALLISLAWPVPRWQLVLSKFLANTLLTWLIVSISWIYYVQLSSYADPEFARSLGGWIGVLLLCLMFNAVALAVSARMGTGVGAAFLSFVVLLVLRLITFLPANLRGKVDQFDPLDRITPMLDGVLPAEDIAYFVVFAAAALAVAVYSIGRRQAGGDRRVLARRVLAVAAVAGLGLATPAIAGATTGQLDLTPAERETISRASQEVLAKVGNVPMTLTAFSAENSLEASRARSTVRKYKAGGANITMRIADPDISPALARSSGVIDYNDYLFTVAGRTQELDDLVESTVTTAIATLTRTDPPRACFVAGHGERRINDVQPEGLTSFAVRLRIIGYTTGEVYLAGDGGSELLQGCDVVLLMGPRSTMPAADLAKLQGYAKNKGRLIVAADSVRGNAAQLNSLLIPWGLKFLPEPVRDPQSLADDPAAIVSSRYPSSSSIVDVLDHDDTPVVFSNSLAVDKLASTAEAGPQPAALVQSSPKSYRVDGTGKKIAGSEAAYTLAAFTNLGELTTGRDPTLTSSRVGVLGSADAASNAYQKAFGNQELLVRLVQYIAEDDAIVSAYREVGENAQFIITGDQRTALITRTVVLPALAALVFAPFVLYRLRRG